MSLHLSKALAAVLGAALGVGLVVPAIAGDPDFDFDSLTDTSPPLYFDLGIDVMSLPTTPAEARNYVNALPALTRNVIIASCDNYLKHPVDAEMPQTIWFCRALLGG